MKFLMFLMLAVTALELPAAHGQAGEVTRAGKFVGDVASVKIFSVADVLKKAKFTAASAHRQVLAARISARKVKYICRDPNNMKTILLDESGVASLALPENLTREDKVSDSSTNGKVSWTTTKYSWNEPGDGYLPPDNVELMIKTYKGDLRTALPDLPSEMSTPELLTLANFNADLKNKNEPHSIITDARILKIGAVTGELTLSEFESGGLRLLTIWHAYRIYRSNAQEIELSITGSADEPAKALEIVKSLKFESASQK